ncbi:MAG: BlaI/MecI/CopY family transcriptional regulator, partial [Planctomycetia bacterium]
MKNANLGQAQLEILRYIMDHHPISVREVADHAARTKGLSRTTILTVMERLREKRYLTRRKKEGVYRYSPTISASKVLHGIVKDFVSNTLQGAMSPLFAYMSKPGNISDREFN